MQRRVIVQVAQRCSSQSPLLQPLIFEGNFQGIIAASYSMVICQVFSTQHGQPRLTRKHLLIEPAIRAVGRGFLCVDYGLINETGEMMKQKEQKRRAHRDGGARSKEQGRETQCALVRVRPGPADPSSIEAGIN